MLTFCCIIGSGSPSLAASAGVASHNHEVEDNPHEITYHDEDLHDDVEHHPAHHQLYFESEIEEKERQYEQHKHFVQQQRSVVLRKPTQICPECNKGFSKRSQFERHLKTHRPLLECQFCSFKSRSKKLHKNHEARHRKDDPQFACTICSMKFVESSLLRGHMGRQHGIFYCPRCNHQAASFEKRNEHMMAEHGVQIKRKLGIYTLRKDDDDDNAEQQNTCSMCFKKCRSRALLRIHVAQHYNVDPNQLSDGLEPLEKNEIVASEVCSEESSEGFEECKVAYTPRPKKKLPQPAEEETPVGEIALANPAEDDPYRKYINDPEVNILARIKPACENAIYRCADCVLDFPNPNSLFMHTVVEHAFLEYDARRRAKEAELENRPNSPGVAEKERKNTETKKAIVKVASSTVQRQFIPYFCRICGPGTKFSKYGMYIVHMKTHRKMRKCPACNFQSRLAMRVLIHQMNSHKRMFRCPRKCLQLFRTKEELDTHKSGVDCKAVAQ